MVEWEILVHINSIFVAFILFMHLLSESSYFVKCARIGLARA